MDQALQILNSNSRSNLTKSKIKYGKALVVIGTILTIILLDICFPTFNFYAKVLITVLAYYCLAMLLNKSDKVLIQEIKADVIGEIKISNKQIKVLTNQKTIHIKSDSKDELKLYINSYFGKTDGYGASRIFHFGIDNVLEINKDIKLYIFLANKEEYETLQSLSSWCLKNKLNIMEFTNNKRTYFGKKLSSNEIQDLKDHQ